MLQERPDEIKVEIIQDINGKVRINGPIGNKTLMFGLLGVAAMLVLNYRPPEEQKVNG